MYHRSCDSSQQLCEGSWLDSFSFPRLPQRVDRPPRSQVCQTGLAPGWISECFPSKPTTQAGWLQMWTAYYFPWLPRSLDERAQASWGAEPCLVTCPSHAERLFHWRITAASTSWFTGWLSAVRDGRERWEEPSCFWRFCRERKSLFFFSLSILGSLDGAKLVKTNWKFPGGSVVRTFTLSLLRAWVQSLLWELRSHKPCSTAK